jgi:hypothetical protein
MDGKRSGDEGKYHGSNHDTVSDSGVSETKEREQVWHPEVATLLIVAPCEMVTAGTFADDSGMVKSADSGCCFVHEQSPPQGIYEIIPSTWQVTIYCDVPTLDTDAME